MTVCMHYLTLPTSSASAATRGGRCRLVQVEFLHDLLFVRSKGLLNGRRFLCLDIALFSLSASAQADPDRTVSNEAHYDNHDDLCQRSSGWIRTFDDGASRLVCTKAFGAFFH